MKNITAFIDYMLNADDPSLLMRARSGSLDEASVDALSQFLDSLPEDNRNFVSMKEMQSVIDILFVFLSAKNNFPNNIKILDELCE